MAHEDLSLVASALAFSTVLSLIPFLAVTLAALNYFDGLETLTPKVEVFLLENFNSTAGSEGIQLLKKGIARIQSGRLGGIGAFVLILTATRMMDLADSKSPPLGDAIFLLLALSFSFSFCNCSLGRTFYGKKCRRTADRNASL